MRADIIRLLSLVPVVWALGGCGGSAETGNVARGIAPVIVTPSGETAPVGTNNADAADDPAIWRNAAAPAASLIVATDKKAGLYVYGTDGQKRSFVNAGLVNNVDVIETKDQGIIVVASDRNDKKQAMLAVFRLDPATAVLAPLGKVPAGKAEAYGICLTAGKFSGGDDNGVTAFSVLKNGQIRQMLLAIDGGTVTKTKSRDLSVPTQPEGCVADEANGHLYIGEEDAGIWQFPLDARGGGNGKMVAPIDNQRLVADVEGLAIIPGANGKKRLIASSQGDNAFAVFDLPSMKFVGRFAIGESGKYGAVSETDGIAVMAGNFGADYPEGLFVAQDGDNGAQAQNFKLVSWKAVREAMKLD
jgi:3-phytase